MKVLVINAGSSSIKYQLLDMPSGQTSAGGVLERIGQADGKLTSRHSGRTCCSDVRADNHQQAIDIILKTLADPAAGAVGDIGDIKAVGHRVVHGGEEFTGSVIIDEKVVASIEKFSDLAPLHNPANLTGIRATVNALPNAVQVACFDTAFHTTIPQAAYLYGLPYEFYRKYRIRRYGFHGTSHRFVARRCAALLGVDKNIANIITCHLGNGCSVTAVKAGKSVDTSMGLTPLEGLIMGTRCGDVDPAILFYLSDKGYTPEQLNRICNRQSGLLGVSETSNDMRNLAALAAGGHQQAALAIDIFCYRVRKYIGAYTAVLGRLDAVVFTAGIGENNPHIRSAACGDMEQTGIEIDERKNLAAEPKERLISAEHSRVKVFVIPTDEERAIAADTFHLAENKDL